MNTHTYSASFIWSCNKLIYFFSIEIRPKIYQVFFYQTWLVNIEEDHSWDLVLVNWLKALEFLWFNLWVYRVPLWAHNDLEPELFTGGPTWAFRSRKFRSRICRSSKAARKFRRKLPEVFRSHLLRGLATLAHVVLPHTDQLLDSRLCQNVLLK